MYTINGQIESKTLQVYPYKNSIALLLVYLVVGYIHERGNLQKEIFVCKG